MTDAELKPKMDTKVSEIRSGWSELNLKVNPLNENDENGRALYRMRFDAPGSDVLTTITLNGNYSEIMAWLEPFHRHPNVFASARARRLAEIAAKREAIEKQLAKLESLEASL